MALFDEAIQIPTPFVHRKGFIAPVKAKTHLFELSPYDETILIDADVIWFPYKPVSELFKLVENEDFAIGCRSENRLSSNPRLVWSTSDEFAKHSDHIYNLSSEFMYFKKTEDIENFFNLAQQYFDEPEIDFKRFDGGVPDELAFQIAMTKTDIKPHKVPFLPFYWEASERKNLNVPEVYKGDWFGYSIGGAHLTPVMKTIYNNLVKFYSAKFGIIHPFLCKSKSELFVNRKNI